jgi:hypothetical protein
MISVFNPSLEYTLDAMGNRTAENWKDGRSV